MLHRVRPVRPLRVTRLPNEADDKDTETLPGPSTVVSSTRGQSWEDTDAVTVAVMLSRPLLALEFRNLKMKVEAPMVISTRSTKEPFGSSFVSGY